MISWNNISSTYLVLHVVLHVHVTTSQNFETEGTEQVFCIFMGNSKMCLHIWEERGPEIADLWDGKNRNSASLKVFFWTSARYEVTDLAHVRHFPGLVVVLHVLQENLLRLKRQLTNLAIGWKKKSQISVWPSCHVRLSCTENVCHTWGFDRAVSALDMALKLEWSHVLAVAMLACCVTLPALTVLLFQLQVVLHMIHEPADAG